MEPDQPERKPEPGDLIEIDRGAYQHWGIYVGDGYIIHLVSSDFAQAASNSLACMMENKAVVKKEKLSDVAGNDKYTINNQLDTKYKPHPVDEILKEAESFVGKDLPYSVVSKNCEHFVTCLRYGKPESQQVQKAVEVGIGMGVAALLEVGGLAELTSSNKEKKQKQ
ncbi:retinoic acid receptor responder 3-like [Clarias gariepinus]|uniref:phospholipase A and acyltransferase 3-like n=1 Tax=Clarias gariepinus TaxID=13013 RepID=UPI00234E0776|nr:phospholipase A and acyltransferase 3-like [Clarias gariepinus]